MTYRPEGGLEVLATVVTSVEISKITSQYYTYRRISCKRFYKYHVGQKRYCRVFPSSIATQARTGRGCPAGMRMKGWNRSTVPASSRGETGETEISLSSTEPTAMHRFSTVGGKGSVCLRALSRERSKSLSQIDLR